MTIPLLSYIVLSYNYEEYIGTTIRSILAQSVQDFEVVVVDDASHDRSCEVVRSFGDPRIRLIVNERNLGGAASYNVAVRAAQGKWLVNLDADDWIAPNKSERQLTAAARNPEVDIIATWVNAVGFDGKPHPDALAHETFVNVDHDFNLVGTWIGKNHLCRSSTMVRRDAHVRIGLDDADMIAAPDYELWTRALAAGCRFHLVKERLTFMRRHRRGVTFANPVRNFLEICFILRRNLLPLIEREALWPHFVALLRWVGAHPELQSLPTCERERLVGLLVTEAALPDYSSFFSALSEPNPGFESVGRRALNLSAQIVVWERERQHLRQMCEEQAARVVEMTEARDFHKEQSEAWEKEARLQAKMYEDQTAWISDITEARNFYKEQSEAWEMENQRQTKIYEEQVAWISELTEARDFHMRQSEAWEKEARRQTRP